MTSNSFAKPLSSKEEAYYLKKMFNGDKDAKDVLIERNLRLVAHIAKKYNNGCYDNSEELISIGTIGLIKGVSSFKINKNTKLATYLAKCIQNEILMSLRVSKKYKNDISLQEPVGFDKEGNEVSIIDKLSDLKENTEKKVEINLQIEAMLNEMKKTLDEKELFVVKYRYGLNTEEKTQRELASILNISRSYVSRIEKKALQKLNKKIK